jgi:hypothetical protein
MNNFNVETRRLLDCWIVGLLDCWIVGLLTSIPTLPAERIKLMVCKFIIKDNALWGLAGILGLSLRRSF